MNNLWDKFRTFFFLPERIPFPLMAAFVILVTATWVPLAFIASARSNISKKRPRIHLFQGMDNQAKIKAQHYSPVFADGLGNRLPVEGTIPMDATLGDPHLLYGYRVNADLEPELVDVQGTDTQTHNWYQGLPASMAGSEEEVALMIERGRLKYDQICATCHGMDGRGNGAVNVAAARSALRPGSGTVWVTPANLLQLSGAGEDAQLQFGSGLYADGQLFNTIRYGKGNMAGHSEKLTPAEAWNVVAYVRTLQFTQWADPEMLAQGHVAQLAPPAPDAPGTPQPEEGEQDAQNQDAQTQDPETE